MTIAATAARPATTMLPVLELAAPVYAAMVGETGELDLVSRHILLCRNCLNLRGVRGPDSRASSGSAGSGRDWLAVDWGARSHWGGSAVGIVAPVSRRGTSPLGRDGALGFRGEVREPSGRSSSSVHRAGASGRHNRGCRAAGAARVALPVGPGLRWVVA